MTILVTGATGTVGRHVVEQLVERGERVRALTRNPARASFPEGVEVVAGDLTVTATLTAAFEGVTAAHLINCGGDDLAVLQNGKEIVDLAVASGVRRVTVLSAWDDGPLEPAVQASSLEWTLVQPTEFMANALDWAQPIRESGEVREPFAATKTAMIHEADIAAVIVTALTEDGHAGESYFLTGPELLDVPEKLRLISEATGQEIRLVELTREQARAEMLAAGVPEEMIAFKFMVFGDLPWGPYAVMPTFEKVTGRPGRTFAQWATENADKFRA
ncbi:NmrA family NAD(P)-binding protein [Nonomuraea dietziae]|uniref:NmrA family NAD(P)-binding protein n=1 Tax=Nonomuraea dietziae TaxID=65515 RepID=UPI003408AC5E